MRLRQVTLAAAVAGLALALAGCGPSSHHAAAIDSATAGPTVAADINQGKALVAKCITGTPLEQLHTLHLLLFTSARGRHATQVTQTRDRVFGCLGIPPGQRAAFENQALTQAEHGHLGTKAGRRAYFEATLPGDLARYQHQGQS